MRTTFLLAAAASGAALILAAPAAASAKVAEVSPDGMRGLDRATQVIVVASPGTRSTHATARTYDRSGDGWRIVRRAMPARLGRNGLSVPTRRHAGDGTTPMGNHGFVYGFGSRPDPGMTGFRWRRVVNGSCWAGTRRHYNRWVDRRPCNPADENLFSNARRAYRYAVVIDFNYAHPVYRRGSGIFLHVTKGGPTAGCVSLREPDLLAVLRWMRPGARIVIGTRAYLESLRRPLRSSRADGRAPARDTP
jgi:L,D-peptidoglycan transpeptidase YkuD (ErfK/YbiS/YcfS/YnhG family)